MLVWDLLHRAEILFWTVSVRLMKNLRAVRILLLSLVIVLILGFVGLVCAVPLSKSSQNPGAQLPVEKRQDAVKIETQRPVHGQRNFLVILVDSITSSFPELQGVWLVGKAPEAPNLIFLPLYPTGMEGELDFWSDRFGLEPDGQPTQEFFEVLRSLDLWWDYYLVLDFRTLAELIERTGGMERNGVLFSGVEVVDNLPTVELEPEAALDAQAQIADNLCRKTNVLMGDADPEVLWGLLTYRMRSDLELETIRMARDNYHFRPGGTSCEFPTFQEMTLLTVIE